MSRFLLVLMLTLGLMLAGCAPPDSQTEEAGNKQRADKAVKDEKPSEGDQSGSEPGANVGDENKGKPEGSGREKQDDEPAPRPKPQPAPGKALASQYEHINAANYGAAYDLFDTQSKRRVSPEEYSAYFASVAPYEIESYSFPSVQVQGDTATVVADLAVSSSEGQEQYQVTQRMVREGESWRVVMRDEQVASFTEAESPSSIASASASASASAALVDAVGEFDATVTVSRVVDGDTIEISPAVSGNEEVRLIGMDTPETKDPSEGIEPLGPEASAFAAEELEGERVGLEFDVEREDQYDRLLAYVYLEGEMFNEILVEEGLAQAYPYEPNTRYEGRFAAAQEEARAAGLGIWGLTLAQQCQLADRGNGIGEGSPDCSGASASASASAGASASGTSSATASPSAGGGGAVPPISEDDCPLNAPIKGNQSSARL